MTPSQTAPHWSSVIEQILATGLSQDDLERRTYMSRQALRHLQNGVQPLHFRGEKLVEVWLAVTGKLRDDVPTTPVVRKPKKARATAEEAKAQQMGTAAVLPQWPPATEPAKKNRGGRPRKAPAAA